MMCGSPRATAASLQPTRSNGRCLRGGCFNIEGACLELLTCMDLAAGGMRQLAIVRQPRRFQAFLLSNALQHCSTAIMLGHSTCFDLGLKHLSWGCMKEGAGIVT